MRAKSAIETTKRLFKKRSGLADGVRRRSALERLWAIRKIRAAKGGRCENCGHQLMGPYCHVCGQRDADFRRPLFAILAEVLENEFSINNKIVQTLLLLLLVPGRLTLSFWRGHRARFMHPFRLYLLASITFFILMWAASNGWVKSTLFEVDKDQRASLVAMLEAYAQEGQEGTPSAEIIQGQQDTYDAGEKAIQLLNESGLLSKEDAERALDDVKRSKERALSTANGQASTGQNAGNSDAPSEPAPQEAAHQEAAQFVPEPSKDALASQAGSLPASPLGSADEVEAEVGLEAESTPGASGAAGVSKAADVAGTNDDDAADDVIKISVAGAEASDIRKIAGNLALVIQDPVKLNNLLSKWVPRAMFLLVPVFAFFLRITHFGDGRYYQQQLVFSLHFHSFLFLLMSILLLVGNVFGEGTGFGFFWLFASVYLVVALRVGQRQSWVRAILKAGPLWCMYFMTMSVVFVFSAYVGLSEL